MYWASDIAAGVKAATADGCDVCSISWGADEQNWGLAAAGRRWSRRRRARWRRGWSSSPASGDNNSADGGATPSNVDAPASCPHVIACGGTRKTPDAETVWNSTPGNAFGEGTGGGYSKFFTPMPPWQNGAPHGRGKLVPDVSANADPATGYNVVIAGQTTPVGGTSAVAPLYAGLFASFGLEDWAGSARSSGKTILPSTTSPRATTASIGRAQAPTRAPA